MNDLSKYVKGNNERAHISDYNGEVNEFPDNCLEPFSEAKSLYILSKSMAIIPASFRLMKNLEELTIRGTKIKQLPALEEISLKLKSFSIEENGLFDLNKELSKLQQLPVLESLTIGSYRGTVFPDGIRHLKHLKELKFGRDLKKKIDIKQLISFIAEMPWLEHVRMDFPIDKSCFNEDFVNVDFLNLCESPYMNFFYRIEQTPLGIGKLKHVRFSDRSPLQDSIDAFREYCKSKDFDDRDRQIAFGLWVKNFTDLKAFLPNLLTNLNGTFTTLCIHAKPKGETIKSIKEKISSVNLTVEKNILGDHVIHVIGPDNEFMDVIHLLEQKQHLITIDHLQELLIQLEDPWLIKEENKEVNEQLLQLLTSNQIENYQIAFQIIEGGGANKTIQTLLAAIMTTHPDKKIFTAAEKLYLKYGSPIYKDYYDSLKIFFRRSSNTDRKLTNALNHPDIDPITFRLMHQLIAGSNNQIIDVQTETFDLSNVSFSEFPEIMIHFTAIKKIILDGCKELNLDQVFSLIEKMPNIKSLSINSSHLNIPDSLGKLTNLRELSLVHNEINNPQCLSNLKALMFLNLEGVKINTWSWLGTLTELMELNIANTGCKTLPQELFSLPKIGKIEAKQNKISSIDSAINQLSDLWYLDVSNNQFTQFPYLLMESPQLSVLMLRSNKIEVFETEKIKELCGAENTMLKELNLSRNKLTELTFTHVHFKALENLDISHNALDKLDDTIFKHSSLNEFYAGNNQIKEIPRSISTNFTYLELQHNKIEELPAFFSNVRAGNCDLRNNLIKTIHSDFNNVGGDKYARLYWKVDHNPIGHYRFK